MVFLIWPLGIAQFYLLYIAPPPIAVLLCTAVSLAIISLVSQREFVKQINPGVIVLLTVKVNIAININKFVIVTNRK